MILENTGNEIFTSIGKVLKSKPVDTIKALVLMPASKPSKPSS